MVPGLKSPLFHGALVLLLFGLQFVLPEYHHLAVTRIILLAVFAMGFNLLFGYTGLLSLGHAMFFSAGMYGAGLTAYHLGWSVPVALIFGPLVPVRPVDSETSATVVSSITKPVNQRAPTPSVPPVT